MFKQVLSAALLGLEAVPVQVEADVSDGLPTFTMVGTLGSQVREAQDRVGPPSKMKASPCRPSVSPSTFPRRISARRARALTCPLPWLSFLRRESFPSMPWTG